MRPVELAALLLVALLSLAPPLPADELPLEEDGSIASLCRQIAGKLASVGERECLDRALEDSGGRSVEARPIPIKEYPPLAGRRPLGRVLLFGGIHGDEYSSVSVVFKWLEILDRHHSGLFHWRISPLVNPDGLLRPDSRRLNAHGVDLNRNFPSPDWLHEAHAYWKEQRSNPRRYPGPAPVSEPESRWLTEEIERFRPDVIVSVHAPYGVVDADGPLSAPARLGSLPRRLLGNYPGSLGRYAGAYKGIPVLTIELESAVRMPSGGEISAIWVDLVRWLRGNLPRTAPGTAETIRAQAE